MVFAPDCGTDVMKSGLLRIGRLDLGACEMGRTLEVDEETKSDDGAGAGDDDRMTDTGLLKVPRC
jgi:hypothetical protein